MSCQGRLLGVVTVSLMFVTLGLTALEADAATCNGVNIEGQSFPATAYSFSTGQHYYNLTIVFGSLNTAVLYFRSGGFRRLTLSDSEIGYDPGAIAAYDYQTAAHWQINIGDCSRPQQPVGPAPRRPRDDDLVATITAIRTMLGASYPEVEGRVCNNATGWRASDIRISFEFYHDSQLPTLDSDYYYMPDYVPSGDCRRFSTTLSALQPWRTLVISRVTWTWSRHAAP